MLTAGISLYLLVVLDMVSACKWSSIWTDLNAGRVVCGCVLVIWFFFFPFCNYTEKEVLNVLCAILSFWKRWWWWCVSIPEQIDLVCVRIDWEESVRSTIISHKCVYIYIYPVMHSHLWFWQLHSQLWDFSVGAHHIMNIVIMLRLNINLTQKFWNEKHFVSVYLYCLHFPSKWCQQDTNNNNVSRSG